MHRFFSIPELVAAIVEYTIVRVDKELDPYPLAPTLELCDITIESWKNLRALHSTSRAFREPCLNAVWQQQTSLIPLLRSVRAIVRDTATKNEYVRPLRLTFTSVLKVS